MFIYENKFEKLKAGTHYGSTGIAQQIQMLELEGASAQELEPFRVYLLSPANYIFEELMTVRGADYDIEFKNDAVKQYENIVKKLTGTNLLPVGINAACDWYKEIGKRLGESETMLSRANIKKAVTEASKKDLWFLQGAAALCTRGGIAAELDDPVHAPSAWDAAFDLWQMFFAFAEASTSHCAGTGLWKESSCAPVWDNFTNTLVRQIQERCYGYIAEKNGAAANACLETLKRSNVMQIEPDIYKTTLKKIMTEISSSVHNCVGFEDAWKLWNGLNADLQKHTTIISSMLGAMAAEAGRIGKANSAPKIVDEAWIAMECERLRDSHNIEVAPAMEIYFQAVVGVSMRVFNDTESPDRQKNLSSVKILLNHINGDYFMGKDTESNDVTAKDLLNMIQITEYRDLFDDFMSMDPCDEDTLEEYNTHLTYLEDNQWDTAFAESFNQAGANKVMECIIQYQENKKSNYWIRQNNAQKLGLIICDNLETDTLIGGSVPLPAARKLLGELTEEEELIEKFRNSDVTSWISQTDFNNLKNCAHRKSWDTDFQNECKKAYLSKLIDCVNEYGKSQNSNAKTLGINICDELPKDETVPSENGPPVSVSTLRLILSGLGELLASAAANQTSAASSKSSSYKPARSTYTPTPVRYKKEKKWSWFAFIVMLIYGSILPGICAIVIKVAHLEIATWFKVVACIYCVLWLWNSIVGTIRYTKEMNKMKR